MTQEHEALETLLMLRQGAELRTGYDVREMVFTVEYREWDGRSDVRLPNVVQFIDSARTWDKAMERAEAAAVAYIEKLTR